MNLNQTTENFKKTINHLKDNLANIRAIGAHPSMLSKVMVEYYGTPTPINQTSSIIAQGGTTLVVTPFDKTILKDIVIAINGANIGLNAIEDGDKVRVPVPALNQEKREQFAKDAKELAEKAKIAIRNIRHDSLHQIQADKTLREDETRGLQDDLQKEVEKANKEIESILKEKVDSLMKV